MSMLPWDLAVVMVLRGHQNSSSQILLSSLMVPTQRSPLFSCIHWLCLSCSYERSSNLGILIWQWWNDFIHGKTIIKKQVREREAAIKKVQQIYTHPPELLQQFPHPTEIPIESQLSKNSRQLKAWLWQLIQQQLITTKEQQHDKEHYGSLYKFFGRPLCTDLGG